MPENLLSCRPAGVDCFTLKVLYSSVSLAASNLFLQWLLIDESIANIARLHGREIWAILVG